MSHLREKIAWELDGFSVEDDLGAEEFFHKEELEAINRYVISIAKKEISNEKLDKLLADWRVFYNGVTDSWYISDKDMGIARFKRNEMNMLVDPKATKRVLKLSADAKPTIDPKSLSWWSGLTPRQRFLYGVGITGVVSVGVYGFANYIFFKKALIPAAKTYIGV